ncbi:hypothetical protein GCM10008171_33360 [Methylopila jiangsuensis]|uniref:Uncharacterized protein n=1 Tax=Methylopila jiangsuensis TaxID=586230 RepID=A0A9W6JJB7_9HYPH|nr:hypothetical protein [Methylopila jiangsuensis]MDR6284530.1 hypothetical protein [Methylopila jiangsuensis]GLK78082.1 hypothetical protein GCM10008171_33360 [Methylopila jiangsuensis]
MLAKRLHVQLNSWTPNDYSESRGHVHELEWYLWFEGRLAYSLFDYGPSDVVPLPGYFRDTRTNQMAIRPMIYPLVVANRFKVRLVAIERDGPQWLDPDDTAKGEFVIDMDKDPPLSTWRIIAADPRNTDLNVEASFEIKWLDYVVTDEIKTDDPPAIVDTGNHPYPWGAAVVAFEHWLGLGRRADFRFTDQNRASRREYWMFTGGPGRPGMAKRMVQDVYRFGVNQIGLPNDVISSLFVPKMQTGTVTVTLYEHDFGDARFAQGAKTYFGTPGLYNLRERGFDDRASAVEISHTYPKPNPSPVN